jgi:hypothetical protein
MAASWTPPRCTTSTGDDTGEMPTTMMERAAWDSSVMPILTGMDADGTSIAVVAEATVHSALPSSTEVSTELRDSYRALDDDGATSFRTETGEAQSIFVEDSPSIVRSGPWTDIPRGGPSSDVGFPQMDSTVMVEHGGQVDIQQGRVPTPVVLGQGITLRPSMTISQPSQTAPADLSTSGIIGVGSSILPNHKSVSDAITMSFMCTIRRSLSRRMITITNLISGASTSIRIDCC